MNLCPAVRCRPSRRPLVALRAGVFGAGLTLAALSTSAQTAISWSATVNGSWGTGTNWTGGSAPASSLTTNYASFNNATGVTVTMGTTQNVAGLDFGSSSGAYTLTNPSGGGKTLTLGAYGINTNSASNQTISGASLTLKLGAASTFTVGSTGSLTLASTLSGVNNNNFGLTLRGTGSGTGTIGAVISGNGSLTKLDSGSWTLSGANTYAGGTIIGSSNGASGGTLVMGANNVLGTAALTVYGGTLNTGSSSFTDTIGAITLGGGASGTTASITGNGTLTLGGNLTYDATNNPGGASIAANIGLGANRTFTVGDSSAAATDLAITGVVSGAFNILKSGTGTLSLAGANTYTGTTTISQGTIQIDANAPSGSAGALGNASSAVTLNDASTGSNNTALLIGTSGVSVGRAITVANLGTGTTSLGGNISSGTGTFTGNVTMNKATTFNADGTSNITFSTGVVSGAGNLTKTGTGTITLSGANTYTGKTSIQAGTLSVDSLNNVTGGTASSNLGAPTTVANGTIDLGNLTTTGTLQYTGTGQTTDRVINLAGSTGGGTIDSSGSGTLTFTGNLTAAAGSKTLTLTGTNTTAAVFSGNIVNSSGTVAVAKSGSGTWTLSGTNTYSGGTTLNTGTLNINSTTALGTGTFTIAGGTIDNTTGSAITLANNNAQAWNGDFTFTGTKDLNLGTGAVTLGATRTVTTTAGNLTIGGAIAGASFGLTKAGAGSLLLTNANSSYTGATTINVGTLSASTLANGGANSSIGASSNSASNLVLNGGTLQYTGNSVTTDRLFSVGTSGGTLDVSTSGQTLTLSNTGALDFNSQTGARTLTLTGAGNGSLAGAIGDNSGATALTKTGAGTWTLTGTNTQTGTTTLSAGTLTVNSGASLSDSTAALVVNAGTLNLNNTSQGVSSFSGSGGTVNLASGNTFTVTDSSADTFSGALAGSGALTKAGSSGSLTLSGNSSSYTGNITVSAGTLTGSGNNSLGGASGTITVSSTGTLALDGGTTITKSPTLSLDGSGATGANGALVAGGATGTTSQFKGNISLAGNATIGAANNLLIVGDGTTFTNTISLGSNTLTFNTTTAVNGSTPTPTYAPLPSYTLDKTQILVNSSITGTGGITKTGSGTVTLMPVASGSSFTGDTVITGGKLIVDSQANVAAIGSNNVYIGNSSSPGPADNVILQIGQLASPPGGNNMVGVYDTNTNASATNLTIYADGVLKMNNASNGFASLTLTGGHVDGGGTTPIITVTGNITSNASSQTAVIENGHLAMGTYGSTTFSVASGTTASGVDLQIKDVLEQGSKFTAYTDSNTSVSKTGSGTMVLSGSNTYHGVTDVTAGILNIQNAAGLGAVSPGIGNTDNGTIVRSGAQLQLQNASGMTIGSETLTLNGTGISNNGALRNVSGNNTYNGYIYLADATNNRINADSGTTLTIANTNGVNSTIMNGTASGKNLTVGGAGNVTVNGGIASNVNNITKGTSASDSGTLTLAGYNGYSGSTDVNYGVVKVTHNNGLSGTGVTVSSGAALQFAQDASNANISVTAVGATLNGTGISNDGAIRNLNGNNSYAGAISLASASRINADTSSSLTLSGGITSTNVALTVGGAGNVTESGTMSMGTGSLTKDGSGTFTFSGSTGTVGATTISGGTIKVAAGTLNTGAIDSVAGTTLAIASGAQVTANYSSGTTIFSGVISDVGGDGGGIFKKTGSGTLVFGSSFNAGSSSTLILDGGTLKLGNTSGVSVTFDTIHITASTTLDFNASYATTLSSSKLVIDAGVQISVINWVSLSDVWYATSTINGNTGSIMDLLNQSPLNQITFSGNSNLATTWVTTQGGQYFNREIRPTPEPSTYGALLLGASLALLGWRRHRRTPRAQADAPLARGAAALKS